jgi:type IV secretion system protein VirD4
MAWSDFHFLKLRHQITPIFLVLPLNRLDGYSRRLRLLVSQALRIERGAERPRPPPPGRHTDPQ